MLHTADVLEHERTAKQSMDSGLRKECSHLDEAPAWVNAHLILSPAQAFWAFILEHESVDALLLKLQLISASNLLPSFSVGVWSPSS